MSITFNCTLANNAYFVARPDTIGSSEEEIEMIERGEVDIIRLNLIKTSLREAVGLLFVVTPLGNA